MKKRTRPDVQPEDLIARRFGRLTVIALWARSPTRWLCSCDCGNTHAVVATLLKNGNCKSCGCLRREVSASKVITHGKAKTAIYALWCRMRSRCFSLASDDYPAYGGRGITVCERWLKFENFFADMGNRPTGKSLERKNNDGNYEPSNCIWATPQQQCRNRRNTKMLTAYGKTMTQAEWARYLGVRDVAIFKAIRRGGTLERFIERRGIDARKAIR